MSEHIVCDSTIDSLTAEVETLRVLLSDSMAERAGLSRHLMDSQAEATATREAVERVRATWQSHLDAVPLGLRCECVGCDMGRALDSAPSAEALGERIALAIEAAADEHNRNIARMAGLPYDPDRHDGAVANGLRRAARIARETT
jgi:hypothetical protein